MQSKNTPKYATLTPFVLALMVVIMGSGRMAWAAAPTITVASPANNATVGAPTYFDATASTTTCAGGISAVRIYSAPGVNAFTTDSFHVEAFLSLKPGTYNTVIQAWDNCGGVTKVNRTITVTAAAGVHVFLPSGTSGTTPVHFAVSAENPACAKGISAVRIYSGPGANAYTASGATLDAFINLLPGTYNATAQAWDNCGNVYKEAITLDDTGGPNGQFLYVTDTGLNNIALYQISNGSLEYPAGYTAALTYGVPENPNSVAVDPPGNFAYAGLADGSISVFEINRANGYLFSKGNVSAPGTGVGPAFVTVDRAGAYLFVSEQGGDFVTTYSINRSSGLLTYVGSFGTASGPAAVETDYTGRYVYTSNYNSDNISGFELNTSTGMLTAIPGSPWAVSGTQPVPLAASAMDIYNLSNVSSMSGFSINGANGSLTQVPGSPWDTSEANNTANDLQLDPFHNLVMYDGIGFTFGTDMIGSYVIQPNGSLNGGADTEGNIYEPMALALDPSYQYLYVTEIDGYTGAPQLFSFKYAASNGAATQLSGPLVRPNTNATQLAVSQ